MHPRNIYKSPPNFKQLAIEYADFRKHAMQDLCGKVHINFKDPDALRALTRTLLKKDFGLDVEIPVDRLIPTVPQRLNYILWIEDLLTENVADDIKRGIDIGTGASCIFPLLGSSKNGWHFLASEIDQASYECATRNVKNNYLQDKVNVVHVSESSALICLLSNDESKFDFCMCNPPFFCDNFDASWEMKARKKTREAPKGTNTASPIEIITQGGEVEFVKSLVRDSLKIKERIKIYTTMLGKKSSVASIKEYMRENAVPYFVFTEFQQGKTLRWGLAWTFCLGIKLNKIAKCKRTKTQKPISFFVPSTLKCTEYSVLGVLHSTLGWLSELNIIYHIYEKEESVCKLWIRSNQNTWSHQRRKKRELLRQKLQTEQSATNCSLSETVSASVTESSFKVVNGSSQEEEAKFNYTAICSTSGERKRKHTDLDDELADDMPSKSLEITKVATDNPGLNVESSTKELEEDSWLLFADMTISLAGRCIMLELRARKCMTSRETLHQISQYFKNKLV